MVVAALFFAVWAIYLLDRIYDTRPSHTPANEPIRHQFARRHRNLMFGLLALTACGGIATILSGLEKKILLTGACVAVTTALYFYVLGWRTRSTSKLLFPLKETAIALCFVLGVNLGAGQSAPDTWITIHSLALFLLFFTNCLVISQAETSHDQYSDPFAFFSSSQKKSRLWIILPSITAVALGIWLAIHFCPGFGIALIVGALGQLAISRYIHHQPPLSAWAQVIADGVLLTPWVAVAFS